MPFDVSIPVGGPAYLTFDSVTYQMASDWTVKEIMGTGEITTNLQGTLEVRDETIGFDLVFTPLAIWGNLTKLFPYAKTSIGNLARGASDKPAVIQTKAGKSLTFAAGYVYASPKISFATSPKKKLFGEMTIRCLIKTSSLPSASGAYVAIASSAYSEPTLDPTTILSPRFTVAWGDTPSTPFDGIETEDGVDFEAKYKWEDVTADSVGIINSRLTDLTAEASLKPVNLTESDYLSTFLGVSGSGSRGRGKRTPGGLFTCTGANTGDPILTMASAQAGPGGISFGKGGRITGLKLMAAQKAVTGVLQPLFALTTQS